MDLSKLSDSDLQLVAKGQVNMLSNDGLNLLANPPQDSLATKVIRGAGDVAGGVVSKFKPSFDNILTWPLAINCKSRV